MKLIVARAGFLTTVQDSGRTGMRQFGVSTGGALDAHGMRVANLLAGNSDTAAGLEITSGTVRLRFDQARIVAWVGGEYLVAAGAFPVPPGRPALVNAQEELVVTGPSRGCRAWLAISGGIDVPMVLGSRSTDLRASFGGGQGRALRDGDELPLGLPAPLSQRLIHSLGTIKTTPWRAPSAWVSPAKSAPRLRVLRGNDWESFVPSAQRAFLSEKFTVSAESDRMGARLEGPLLERKERTDLVSEAVVAGTVQVPPGGLPILLLGDCQTIGGYPKIGHVITVDLARAAQLSQGEQVWFREVLLAEAQHLLWEREKDFQRFQIGLSLHCE